MPYVNVPNDLSKIKTKIAFNLTKRQLICFGIGAAVGIPTYLLTRQAIGNTGALFPPRHPPVPNEKYLCPICAKGEAY